MEKIHVLVSGLVIVVLGIIGYLIWDRIDNDDGTEKDPIVGAWFVEAPDAPFAYHMFLFSADGTMHQANPDAGNSVTSDGDGKGIWIK
ncbi:MAG TPA: hypothetical protein VHK27_01780, partial [Gammaproteobacteria bacterium]|nr:hypothetical protein [Gammaproteobacteria bacterium]